MQQLFGGAAKELVQPSMLNRAHDNDVRQMLRGERANGRHWYTLDEMAAIRWNAMPFCQSSKGLPLGLTQRFAKAGGEAQAWDNLRLVLSAGGCEFEDVVEMTTYHVDMHRHMPIFRR